MTSLIDFYFACTDTLVYDVTICLNAWCFEPDHSYNVTKGRALLASYARTRPLSPREWENLPLYARGASVRFLLTRLVDWLDVPPGALGAARGSSRIFTQAALSPEGDQRPRLRNRRAVSPTLSHVIIHTDGACSGNPGPGGWAAILAFGDHEKELKGGELLTTNNRMELMAAIAALEALKRPCRVDLYARGQRIFAQWHHVVDHEMEAKRLANRRQKPVKNADLWRRLDAALSNHQIRWHWVRGHAGHDINERADTCPEAIAEIRSGAETVD